MPAGEAVGRMLRGLGLRRKHLTGFPLRPAVRVLTARGLVSWDKLSGPPLDLVHRMHFPGASFRYHVVPGDLLGTRLFWEGWRYWEPDVLLQFSRYAVSSPRILDIGAHTGIYSLFACALHPDAEVFSFEPLSFIYERLLENIEINGFRQRCRPFQAAVGDIAGTARFHIAEDLTMSTVVQTDGEMEIPVVTLDNVVPHDGRTRLVKIDVEGYEYKVLGGMRGILEDSQPAILFECNPGGDGAAISALLRQHGYRLFNLTDVSAEITELVPERFSKGNHNFLALGRSQSTV
jgi:FkbM family methyltransferase